MEDKSAKQHKVSLMDRQMLDVSGIINVEKFTDENVVLETEQGTLDIKGEKMHMKQLNLDGGMIIVEGLIKSLTYSDGASTKDKGKGLLRNIFK